VIDQALHERLLASPPLSMETPSSASLSTITKQYRRRYTTIQQHIDAWKRCQHAIDAVVHTIITLLPRLTSLQTVSSSTLSSSTPTSLTSSSSSLSSMHGNGNAIGVLGHFEGLHQRLIARHVEQIDLAMRTIHEWRCLLVTHAVNMLNIFDGWLFVMIESDCHLPSVTLNVHVMM
jgi:hypothetical protein